MSPRLQFDPVEAAKGWLSSFASGVHAADAHAVTKLFESDGWLRDVLTFTWDLHALEGRHKISNFLSDKLAAAQLASINLSEDPYLRPRTFEAGPVEGLEFGFIFETPIAWGKGYARLVHHEDEGWLGHVVSTIITDLKHHEEPAGRYNFEDFVEGLKWGEYTAKQRAAWEADPHVLIVGGGQVGLQVAARFKQMDIPSILIERNERIGDNWRKRYDSLALHTLKEHHQLLYQPHPTNWPLWPPRDRVANMLETYAITQELLIWTQSHINGRPTYDQETQKWTVAVSRNGRETTLHPAHIVLATGGLGDPQIPQMEDQEKFAGEVLHSAQFRNATPFRGKRVLVVGAGNSSIDICQDLAQGGAASVTMIQRSPVCVASRDIENVRIHSVFPPDIPIEVVDLKFASLPKGYITKMAMSEPAKQYYFGVQHKDVIDKVQKGGFLVSCEKPQVVLWFEKLGGYWWDKGAADLIASGDIKIKTRVSPVSFTESGVIFSDGSELPADAVVFATGFVNIREVHKQTFGEEVIRQTHGVWGLDEEGEVRGCFRPSGYPGLWFAAADFTDGRFQSKQLAIMIKAIELGYMKQA